MQLNRIVFSLLILSAIACLIPLLTPLAQRLLLVDHPNERKQHGEPVPLVGGIAMACAIAPGMLLLAMFAPFPVVPRMWISVSVAIGMLGIGTIDDYRSLPSNFRLIAQILGALVLANIGGYQVHSLGALGELGVWSLPFTVLVVVTFMNACNMVDGADGILGCTLLPMFVAVALVSHPPLSWGTAMMAALVFGFLVFNWPGSASRTRRRRIFLGNGGVMFVATMGAALLIRACTSGDSPLTAGSAPWLTMIPLVEMATTIVRRAARQISPMRSDRGHLHHRALAGGMSPGRLAASYLAASTVCAAIGALGPQAGIPDALLWAGAVTVLATAATLEMWRAIRVPPSATSAVSSAVSGLQVLQDDHPRRRSTDRQ